MRDAFVEALTAGDVFGARTAARAILAENPTVAQLRFLSGRIAALPPAAGVARKRVALLSSYSSEFVHDALIAASFIKGVVPDIYSAGFNQYQQELIDPESGLYRFAPDVLIVSVLGEDILPSLYRAPAYDEPDAKQIALGNLSQLLTRFRERSNAAILVQNMLPPVTPLFGVGDATLPFSQRRAIQRFNEGLTEAVARLGSAYIVDYEGLVARHGALAWHDERMRHFARLPIEKRMFLPLAEEFAKFLRILSGGAKKCIVVDLDNTLWGGVLGEDGIDGIKLDTVYPGSAFKAVQELLLALRDRGILLAIASKNNPADVDEVFERHPHAVVKRNHFAHREIGWNRKSDSLKAIAEALNIGLEHLLFVDDNPVELAEVREALPMVESMLFPERPELFPGQLMAQGYFDDVRLSAEDRSRAQLYAQRSEAEESRKQTGNIEDFYRKLQMTITLDGVTGGNLARAAQLTQKTNQFNLTTRRYSEAEVKARAADPDWVLHLVSVKDVYGDNGIVGFAMAKAAGPALVVDTFLMSCRVIGRTVETAMLAALGDAARARGLTHLRAELIETAKNAPVREVLPGHHFAKVSSNGACSVWEYDLASPLQWPEWFRIEDKVARA
jgi:FkbH-like protein